MNHSKDVGPTCETSVSSSAQATVEPDSVPEQPTTDDASPELPIIEADDDATGSDTDSAFGGSVSGASYTTSLRSEALNYVYENGRRYHGYQSGVYPLPNDEPELNRLDMQHHVQKLLLKGELYRAPVKSPQRVLDVGTGTGIWAIEFAELHPQALVTGTDLSPVQPRMVPPNLNFFVDDAEKDWVFPESCPFDFIHIANMGGSIADWPRLLHQAYSHLAEGAWIEVVDFEVWASTDDDSLPESSSYVKYQRLLDEASSQHGRKMNVAPQHEGRLIDAGFKDVRDYVVKVPLSPWAKDREQKVFGSYMLLLMLEAIKPYSLALFSRILEWTPEELEVLLAGVRSDLYNKNYHMYTKLHYVYGRKPHSTTTSTTAAQPSTGTNTSIP